MGLCQVLNSIVCCDVVIIGVGVIGFEVVLVVVDFGKLVMVVEVVVCVMVCVVLFVIINFVIQQLMDVGVKFFFNKKIEGFDVVDYCIFLVNFEDGIQVKVDLVFVGIGVILNVEFVEVVGIECDEGICVD